MNLDWKAIGIGAAVGIAFSLLIQVGFRFLPVTTDPGFFDWWRWIGPLLGLLADVAVGAAAGWLASQNHALHGALASLIAAVVSVVLGTAMTVTQAGIEWLLNPWYWLTTLFWIGVGVAVAALAAIVAGRILKPALSQS